MTKRTWAAMASVAIFFGGIGGAASVYLLTYKSPVSQERKLKLPAWVPSSPILPGQTRYGASSSTHDF